MLLTFLAVLTLSAVHIWAKKTEWLDVLTRGYLLSMGSGVAIAYVFIDLLPKLSRNDDLLSPFFPYIERHAYLMALLGFVAFFVVDQSEKHIEKRSLYFWISLGSYSLFNFLVGYAIADPYDPEVQPLLLFTIAMALHYFVNDYSLSTAHGNDYQFFGSRILVGSLLVGWSLGLLIDLPKPAIALVSAFIGGGVIMNVTRHELAKNVPQSVHAFLFGVFFYTALLLSCGA